jgi:hypothetical protein
MQGSVFAGEDIRATRKSPPDAENASRVGQPPLARYRAASGSGLQHQTPSNFKLTHDRNLRWSGSRRVEKPFQISGGSPGIGEEVVPGVAILLEACVARATVRVEAQRGARGQGVGGNEVPDVERENVSGEEVDVVGGEVTLALANAISGLDFVSADGLGGGGFDLHAPEAGAGVDDEVVAFAVAPGLGDADLAELGGVEEGGLGEFSDALRVRPGPARGAGATRGREVGVDAGVEERNDFWLW